MRLNPFFRCHCGKIHVVSHITLTTVCRCGLSLYEQVWINPREKRDADGKR